MKPDMTHTLTKSRKRDGRNNTNLDVGNHLDRAVFGLSDLSDTATYKDQTVKSYAAKGYLIGFEAGSGTGNQRNFSWHTLMQLAMARPLIKAGIPPARAFEFAGTFAHVGKGGAGWAGNLPDTAARLPGFPHHQDDGDTILSTNGDKGVVHLEGDQHVRFDELDAVITINCTRHFEVICEKLGRPPYEVLDAVYGRENPVFGDD